MGKYTAGRGTRQDEIKLKRFKQKIRSNRNIKDQGRTQGLDKKSRKENNLKIMEQRKKNDRKLNVL